VNLSEHPSLAHWFRGRRACVVGAGRSGTAAAAFLRRCGAVVALTDSRRLPRSERPRLPRDVRVETGGHRLLSETWDLAVVSPGVPERTWRPLAEKGVPVWGELELGYRALTLAGRWPRRCAAVTGTNGKTTTTALLGAMMRAAGARTVVAGNIGTPLCEAAEGVTAETALVLEVSSYQLETASAFRPSVGTVLNVTPDHLGRHGTLARYAGVKFGLFRNGTPAVLNAADPWCVRHGRSSAGRPAWFSVDAAGRVGECVFADGTAFRVRREELLLPGRHNLENALAAAACARLMGAPAGAVRRALATFRGVEHRLETVRERRRVRYINDSKATNVDSTLVALRALPGPLWVVLGGEDKGSPYAPLRPWLKRRARAVLLIGEAAGKIERELRGAAPMERCGTLERAVALAAREARPGDTVLLSPACASFDQFRNFEHRGRRFKELVASL
jgi:UDP-N-acetylmuramoylalanine--D-glutamate ligase